MVLPVLFAGAIAVTACDDDNTAALSVGPGGGSSTERGVGSISENHGHVATIASADLTAGNATTLDMRGTADHSHFLDLTGAEVVQIRQGQRVSKPSTTDMSTSFGTHSHTVTFN
jgi:hypothetical protein